MTEQSAIVIHPHVSVWEVWSAGVYGIEYPGGRYSLRGTFVRRVDADMFADLLNTIKMTTPYQEER